jgi:4-amino-4-deoxy-L-arabinose transferase-like glycosyltransferase
VTPERLRWTLLVVAMGVSVVVVALTFNPAPHTGGDNAGYVALAHGLVTTGTYTDAFDPEGLPHTKYPPVFPAILALMVALGARTWAVLKLTSVVATVATVGLTYLWTERSIGAVGAFAIALLLSLCSGVVYYSHWVLSDPVFVTLTVAALLAFARADEEEAHRWWLPLGVVAAGLAYFTRSAGLPLIMALLVWLALRRRWRAAGWSAATLGLPMLLWWLRGRSEGVAQYGAEFWMVDPYRPAFGNIGVFDLVRRVIANLAAYVFEWAPAGIVWAGGPPLAPLGVLLALVTIAGWVLSIRSRIGPAEIFFPLYLGLILVWPLTWGGDRFFLPLYPLVFLYGALTLREIVGRLPTLAGSGVTALAVLILLLPAGREWLGEVGRARTCSAVAEQLGHWACHRPEIEYFAAAAVWSATRLPAGSAVLTRKPRHFYVLSGHASRTFPFDEDPAAHLALADSVGARYLLLDQWDGQAVRFVGSAITEQPGAFCYLRPFGQPEQGGAQLLGILAPADRVFAVAEDEETGVLMGTCSEEYSVGPASGIANYTSSGRIPLLDGLDS